MGPTIEDTHRPRSRVTVDLTSAVNRVESTEGTPCRRIHRLLACDLDRDGYLILPHSPGTLPPGYDRFTAI